MLRSRPSWLIQVRSVTFAALTVNHASRRSPRTGASFGRVNVVAGRFLDFHAGRELLGVRFGPKSPSATGGLGVFQRTCQPLPSGSPQTLAI